MTTANREKLLHSHVRTMDAMRATGDWESWRMAIVGSPFGPEFGPEGGVGLTDPSYADDIMVSAAGYSPTTDAVSRAVHGSKDPENNPRILVLDEDGATVFERRTVEAFDVVLDVTFPPDEEEEEEEEPNNTNAPTDRAQSAAEVAQWPASIWTRRGGLVPNTAPEDGAARALPPRLARIASRRAASRRRTGGA